MVRKMQDFVDEVWKIAIGLAKEHEMVPMLFAWKGETSDTPFAFPMPWSCQEERTFFLKTARNLLQDDDYTHYVVVSEAWCTEIKGDDASRAEILIVAAVSRNGETIAYTAQITRPSTEERVIGEKEILNGLDGDLANLFNDTTRSIH